MTMRELTYPAGCAAAASARARAIHTLPMDKLTLNGSTGEIKANADAKTSAGLKGPEVDQLLSALGEERSGKLRKNSELKGISVEVEQQANSLLLKGLSAT